MFPSRATDDDSSLVDESYVSSNGTLVDVLGAFLLKLDCIFNVPSRCIDEIIGELQFITSSVSAPVIKTLSIRH